MMEHVIHISGGAGSWATARLIRDRHPQEPMTILFADTLIEDEETYAFLEAAASNIGVPLTRIAEGRTPWQVFKDEGFLGNTRVDLCSRILKRDLLRQWLNDNCDPETTINYIGIDWTEIDRFERARPLWAPWRLEAPLTETSLSKADLLVWAAREGLPTQRLYEMGMPHANCGGGCVKAGQGHFAKLLWEFPERFAEWEHNEQDVREHINKDVAILRDRTGGTTTPLTLARLRTKIEASQTEDLDLLDLGGCGCAID